MIIIKAILKVSNVLKTSKIKKILSDKRIKKMISNSWIFESAINQRVVTGYTVFLSTRLIVIVLKHTARGIDCLFVLKCKTDRTNFGEVIFDPVVQLIAII